MSNKRLSMALVTIAAMAVSAPAAAFVTYFVGASSSCSGSGLGGRTCTTSDATVTANAHAFTGEPSNSVVEGAFLGVYSGGLGVTYQDSTNETTSSPQHALDNDNRFEFIRVDFGMKVALTAVTTGWVESDADITLLAHNGGAGDTNPNGENIAGLTTNGWSLVAHYNGTSADSQTINVNSGGAVESRYWLIGAFDPDFGGAFNGADWSNTTPKKFDYLKVYAVKWDKPSKASEPATLMLFGAGLLAWLSARRRAARI